MTDQQVHFGSKAAAIGGTFTSIVANVNSGDLVKTVILASVGTLVSFILSLLLKTLFKWFTGKPPPK